MIGEQHELKVGGDATVVDHHRIQDDVNDMNPHYVGYAVVDHEPLGKITGEMVGVAENAVEGRNDDDSGLSLNHSHLASTLELSWGKNWLTMQKMVLYQGT